MFLESYKFLFFFIRLMNVHASLSLALMREKGNVVEPKVAKTRQMKKHILAKSISFGLLAALGVVQQMVCPKCPIQRHRWIAAAEERKKKKKGRRRE